jgi:hypothetical protein
MKTANEDSEAKLVLERLIRTLPNARTLYYEGNKTHPNRVAGQADGPGNDKRTVNPKKYRPQ